MLRPQTLMAISGAAFGAMVGQYFATSKPAMWLLMGFGAIAGYVGGRLAITNT
jgi:uncharacterized membrane protein YfcA